MWRAHQKMFGVCIIRMDRRGSVSQCWSVGAWSLCSVKLTSSLGSEGRDLDVPETKTAASQTPPHTGKPPPLFYSESINPKTWNLNASAWSCLKTSSSALRNRPVWRLIVHPLNIERLHFHKTLCERVRGSNVLMVDLIKVDSAYWSIWSCPHCQWGSSCCRIRSFTPPCAERHSLVPEKNSFRLHSFNWASPPRLGFV